VDDINSSFTIPDGRRLAISGTGLVYQSNEAGTWTDWWKSYYGNGKFVSSRTGTNIDFEYPGVYLLIEGVQRNNVAFTPKIGVYIVSFASGLITYNKIFDGYDSAPTVSVSGTTLQFVHGSSLNLGIVSYRLY